MEILSVVGLKVSGGRLTGDISYFLNVLKVY